jgi:hypothetical protein
MLSWRWVGGSAAGAQCAATWRGSAAKSSSWTASGRQTQYFVHNTVHCTVQETTNQLWSKSRVGWVGGKALLGIKVAGVNRRPNSWAKSRQKS